MRLVRLLSLLTLLVFTASTAFAQRGKIAGTVTDGSTGETLPGVNILIEGTQQGAVSDADGFYFINNVRPGTYTLRASFIGFISERIAGVRVSTDLTSTINIQMREEAVR